MLKSARKIKALILVLGDLLIAYLALAATLFIRYQSADFIENWRSHLTPFSIIFGFWLVIFFIVGLYDFEEIKNRLDLLSKTAEALIAAVLISLAVFYFVPGFKITPKINLAIAVAVYAALFVGWRILSMHLFSRPSFRTRLIFLGAAPETDDLCKVISASPQLGYSCLAVIDHLEARTPIPECDLIVVSHRLGNRDDLTQALYERFFAATHIVDLPSFYEKIRRNVAESALSEQWVLNNLAQRDPSIYDQLKRPFDILLAVILSIPAFALSPLIAAAIWLDDHGPIFFAQERVGMGGKAFHMHKFRTMRVGAEKDGAVFAQKTDPRVTRVGAFLRRSRLDELPQLWNILRGDMSFVGPRPERPEFEAEIAKTIPLFPVRHLLRPGLTGWAQVNAPYASTMGDHLKKLRLDLYYLKNRSLMLDAAIVLRTVYSVFKRRGQ